MDNVDGGAVLFDEALDDGVEVVNKVLKLQGNRANGVRDKGCVTPGAFPQLLRDFRGVTKGGREEDELRVGEFQQRYLPGPAALRIAVEVELIHDDHVGVQVCALAQRLVGKDLSGATDDGCLRVEGNVAGHHPHIGGAESINQVKELFRHQCLQGGGVV